MTAWLLLVLLGVQAPDAASLERAVELYRAGDPVAAEVTLGPLLDAPLSDSADSARVRAGLLVWGAIFADAQGRTEVATGRLATALSLYPDVTLPPDASLRLAGTLEELRRGQANAPVAAPPPPLAEAPAVPPSSASPTPPPAAKEPAAPESPTGPPIEPEKEDVIQISTSLWAVAGGALTFGILLGAGAAVFGVSGALHYLEAQNPDTAPDRVDDVNELAASEARFTAVLGAVALGLFALSGAAAGGALWLE